MELAGQFDDVEAAFATEIDAELRVQTIEVLGDPLRVVRVEGVCRDRDDEQSRARVLLSRVEGGCGDGEAAPAVDGEELDHEGDIAALDSTERQQGAGEGGLGMDRGRPVRVLCPPFGDRL